MHISKQQKRILLTLLKERSQRHLSAESRLTHETSTRSELKLTQRQIIYILQDASNEYRHPKNVYPSVSRSLKTLSQNHLVEQMNGAWSLTEKGIEEARKIKRDIISQFNEFRAFL